MKVMKKLIVLAAAAALGLPSAGPAFAARRTPVVEAVEKALPSVVNIGTERLVKMRYSDPMRRVRGDLFDQFFSEFFGGAVSSGYRVQNSLGSGVIVDPRGYILTNHHVIERASKIRVTLSDESTYDAVLLAGDEVNDLALIKITPEKPLKAVDFAADDDVLLGEPVIVLGNPFGLSQTVTVGVVSSKNREARYDGQVLYRDILQTDAAVNPGSSGGPLLNSDGNLIGINVAIYREAQNIGFAVPVKRVRALLGRWLTPRLLTKTWPGFEPEDRDGVLRVALVDTNAAAAGGFKRGDIVKELGDQAVGNLYDFNRALLAYQVGDRISVKVEREGAVLELGAVVVALPKPSGPALAKRLLGLEFAQAGATQAVAKVVFTKGLEIEAVAEGSVGAKAGLRPGLFVTRIGDSEINTPDDVGLALEKVRAGDEVAVGILSLEETGSFIVAQSSRVQMRVEAE